MSIEVRCPRCQRIYAFGADKGGQMLWCRRCGAGLTVPDQTVTGRARDISAMPPAAIPPPVITFVSPPVHRPAAPGRGKLIAALVVGFLLICLCFGALLAFVLVKRQSAAAVEVASAVEMERQSLAEPSVRAVPAMPRPSAAFEAARAQAEARHQAAALEMAKALQETSVKKFTFAMPPPISRPPFEQSAEPMKRVFKPIHTDSIKLAQLRSTAIDVAAEQNFKPAFDTFMTPIVGCHADGKPWISQSKTGEDVVGFRYTQGNWGKPLLRTLDPLYDRLDEGQADVCVAKPGYVVGGILVDSDETEHAVKVIFIKSQGGHLDMADFYVSDWLGTKVTSTKPKLLGASGEHVIGICGYRGMNLDGVGLVLKRGEEP